MPTRRTVLIRTVASVAGDIAAAVAIASACAWFIEYAALGVFLSFLLWMLGALLSLAFSQYVVHPAVNALVCDRKFDAAVDVALSLAFATDSWARATFTTLRSRMQPA